MKEYYWSKIIEKAYSYPMLKRMIKDFRRGLDEISFLRKYLSRKDIDRNEESRFYKMKKAIGFKIISIYDNRYFLRLREIDLPPIAFYFKGSEKVFNSKYIGVVGSRIAKDINLKKTRILSSTFSRYGYIGVSGLAKGIDGACHDGCNTSIGVIGSGIDIVYPRVNTYLYDKLSSCGGIISEYPLSFKPLGYHFPRRNRIIAGIVDFLVVMEGKEKSGALITLDYALDYSREVFLPSYLLKEDYIVGNSIRDLKKFIK